MDYGFHKPCNPLRFGKWHLGKDPTTQGFDVAVQHQHITKRGHYMPDGSYLADALTDLTVKFIEDNKNGPWCAYLAHFGVHTPLHPKKNLLPKYEAKKPGTLHNHVVMATTIQAIDDSVGRLVAELDLYPTFCAIAGAPLPEQPVDGRSLLSLWKGGAETFGPCHHLLQGTTPSQRPQKTPSPARQLLVTRGAAFWSAHLLR